MPSLPERDAELHQRRQLLVTFDPLGDHQGAEPAGEDVDELGQRPPDLVDVCVGDEIAIEFDQLGTDPRELA